MTTASNLTSLARRERSAPSRLRNVTSFFRDPAVLLSSLILGLVMVAAIAPSVIRPFEPNKIGAGEPVADILAFVRGLADATHAA